MLTLQTDPQVSTLNTLNNVQNSLFVPDLGRFLNRRPTYTLSRFPTKITENSVPTEGSAEEEDNVEEDEDIRPDLGRMSTIASITSHMDDTHFAVLPHGERLRGWSAEERAELNDHVRHLLHSRREKFKRGMKGFGQYVRKRKLPIQTHNHLKPLLPLSHPRIYSTHLTNTTQPSASSSPSTQL